MKSYDLIIRIKISGHGRRLDLHKTLTSIVKQAHTSKYKIFTTIDASDTDIPRDIVDYLTEREGFLTKNNINIASDELSKIANARYILNICAGNIVSHSFLYKAIESIKRNSSIAVAPEATFIFHDRSSHVSCFNNAGRILNDFDGCLVDLDRLNSGSYSRRITSITDTCYCVNQNMLGGVTYFSEILPFPTLRKLSSASFRGWLELGSEEKREELLSGQKTRLSSAKDFIKKAGYALCKDDAALTYIAKKTLAMYKKIFRSHRKEEADMYISEPMKLEIAGLGDIDIEVATYLSRQYDNYTQRILHAENALLQTYATSCEQLDGDSYDYVFIVPWLIHGGADLFIINYANSIAQQDPSKRVLIITTEQSRGSAPRRTLGLDKNVALLDLPKITSADYGEKQAQLIYTTLSSLLNNIAPRVIHVVLSELGYNYVAKYGDVIRSCGEAKIVFTGYNYLTSPANRKNGYSVEHMVENYQYCDLITTDSESMKEIWVDDFGFDDNKVLVHKQLLPLPSKRRKRSGPTKNILWAAHIRKEKNPEMVVDIARALQGRRDIKIECYGELDPHQYKNENPFISAELPNIAYKGAYKNFFQDINLNKYDLFLYTSRNDGTPNVVLEAGLAALPIVSSAIGGIPSALGKGAVLIHDVDSTAEFAGAIESILSNEVVAEERATKLRNKLAKLHSPEEFDKQISTMLKKLNY